MITVVHGPPCAGKSTYVRNHAAPGDIVIDFDEIARALGSPVPHDHSAAVRHVTVQARRAAIQAALTVHHQVPVWIVATTLTPQQLREYQQAGAVIVRVGADKGELHKRASRERPALWHRLIDEWSSPVGDSAQSSREW